MFFWAPCLKEGDRQAGWQLVGLAGRAGDIRQVNIKMELEVVLVLELKILAGWLAETSSRPSLDGSSCIVSSQRLKISAQDVRGEIIIVMTEILEWLIVLVFFSFQTYFIVQCKNTLWTSLKKGSSMHLFFSVIVKGYLGWLWGNNIALGIEKVCIQSRLEKWAKGFVTVVFNGFKSYNWNSATWYVGQL